MINANVLCSFCCIEELLFVLDVSSLTSSHFVLSYRSRLIAFLVSFWVFLFFSIFCVLLHCIVFSVVLLDGINVYIFWLPVLCTTFFSSILLFSFNSWQSRFSSFQRDCFCVNNSVEIRVEMSWFFVSFSFLRNKISFSRLTMYVVS